MNKLRVQFDLELADGNTVTVLMNMYALGQYVDESGIELGDLEDHLEKNVLSNVLKLLWHGAQAFSILQDTELPYSKDKFMILLGSTPLPDLLKLVGQAMNIDDGKKKSPQKRKKVKA